MRRYIAAFFQQLAQFRLWGMNLSLRETVRFIQTNISRDSIQTRAAAVAYNGLLATFPFILFFFSLLSYLPVRNLQDDLFIMLPYMLPDTASRAIIDVIKGIGGIPRKGWFLLIGLLLTLYFASNGMRALMRAFRKADNPDFVKRKFLKYQAVSIWLVLLLVGIVIATITIAIVGKAFINWAITHIGTQKWFGQWLLRTLRTLLFFSLVFNSIAIIYYLAPSKRTLWGYFTPGATLATLFCLISSTLFSAFVNSFNPYSKAFGSLGTLIVVMIWYYIVSLGLILGFELNVSFFSQNDDKDSLLTNTHNFSAHEK
ncbi:MAG: YihY/virulence factor BrkB family protein [Chitinophagales bacterium]|jgi:membrane protein|nr:YihY/virulence factor BrkB family protein [Chitinophagales bacterium]